jgi:hypothetical protein
MFCVSDAVVLEVLINPLKQQYDPLVGAYRKIFEKGWDLKVYTGLFKEALSIAYAENLRAMDSIHVAITRVARFLPTRHRWIAKLPTLLG